MTFALGSALAAAAGILYGIAYPVLDPYMGIICRLEGVLSPLFWRAGIGDCAALAGFLLDSSRSSSRDDLSIHGSRSYCLFDHNHHPHLPAPRVLWRTLQCSVKTVVEARTKMPKIERAGLRRPPGQSHEKIFGKNT